MPEKAEISADSLGQQGALRFGEPRFDAQTYVNSPQNERARAALARWQTWPGGVFCIFGETGAGKSHLGSLWAEDAEASCHDGAALNLDLAHALIARGAPRALIDHADASDETALFALLTHVDSQGGAVLLIGYAPPSHWPFALPDLRSRLAALACEGLKAPDTELLAQLILRHGAARGFKLDAAACVYLADRIPRTCDATRAIVAAMEVVTRPSLKSSMALAQRALQHFYQSTAPEPDEDDSVARDLFDE